MTGWYDWDQLAGLGWFAVVVLTLCLLALMISWLAAFARAEEEQPDHDAPFSRPSAEERLDPGRHPATRS